MASVINQIKQNAQQRSDATKEANKISDKDQLGVNSLTDFLSQFSHSSNEDVANATTDQMLDQQAQITAETPEAYTPGGQLQDFAVSTLEGIGNTVFGGLHTFVDPDTSHTITDTFDLSEWKSGEGKARAHFQQEDLDIFNKRIDIAIDQGRISELDGTVAKAKNLLSNLNSHQLAQLAGSVVGSIAPLTVAAIYGGPAVFGAVMAGTGFSTLGEAVTNMRDDLYAKGETGAFKYTHEDLMNSPEYQKVFEETGSEVDARASVYKKLQFDLVTDPAVVGSATLEVLGDYLLLKMGGVVKGTNKLQKLAKKDPSLAKHLAKQTGKKDGVLKTWAKQGASEGPMEFQGGLTRQISSNIAIRDEFDPDKKVLEGTEESALDLLGGIGSGPAVSATKVGAVVPKAAASLFAGTKDKISTDKKLTEAIQGLKNTKTESSDDSDGVPPAGGDISKYYADVDPVEYSETSQRYTDSEGSTLDNLYALNQAIKDSNTPQEDLVDLINDLRGTAEAIDADGMSVIEDLRENGTEEQKSQFETAMGVANHIRNNKELVARLESLEKEAKAKTVEIDSDGKATPEGIKTVKEKLALSPESLSEKDLDSLESFEAFSPEEQDKIQTLRNLINAQHAIDQRQADAGMNSPTDLVSREITSDVEKGKKGFSALRHVFGIMDSMRNNNLNAAKDQMTALKKLTQSQYNKLTALRAALEAGEDQFTYTTYNHRTGKEFSRTMPVVGTAKGLVANTEKELAFLQAAYNDVIGAYGTSLGEPLNLSKIAVEPSNHKPTAKPRSSGSQRFSSANQPQVVHTADSLIDLTEHELESLTTEGDSSQAKHLKSLVQAEQQRRSKLPDRPVLSENLKKLSDKELNAVFQEYKGKRVGNRTASHVDNMKLITGELNDRAKAKKEVKAESPKKESESKTADTSQDPVTKKPGGIQEAHPQEQQPVEDPATNRAEEDALRKAKEYTARQINALQKYPKQFHQFYREALGDIPANEFTKLIQGEESNLSLDDLRLLAQLANMHGQMAQAEAREQAAEVPTQSQEIAEQVSEEPTAAPELTLQEQIDKAIEDGADNVRMINLGGHENPYVLIDGVIYNKKGKRIIHQAAQKVFEGQEVADPDVEATAKPEPEVSETEKEKASNLKKSIPVGKYIKIAAGKTKLYIEGFLAEWASKIKKSSREAEQTYFRFLGTARQNIQSQIGGYDAQGNPSGFIAKAHEATGTTVLNTLVGNRVAQRKAFMKIMEPFTGITDDAEFVEWIKANFPKETGKATEVNAKQRARLAQMIGEEKTNEVFRDLASMVKSLRFMDLLQYDPTTNRFSLPDEVLNAASLAMTDFMAGYHNNTYLRRDIDKVKEKLGINEGKVNITKRGESESSEITHLSLVSDGIMRYEHAMENISRIIGNLLGSTRRNDVGVGLSDGPFQSLAGSLLEGITKSFGENAVFDVVLVELAEPDAKGEPRHSAFLVGKSLPLDPSKAEQDAENHRKLLKEAGTQANDNVLTDPDKMRYVEEVPKAKTRDKQGNPLTVRQVNALEAQNSIPFQMNTVMQNLWNKVLGPEGIVKLLGHPDADNPSIPMNMYDREAKRGKNLQLKRAIEEIQGLLGEIESRGLDPHEAKVYFNAGISSVSRNMMDGGNNPQGDKVIRSIMSPHRGVIDVSAFLENILTGQERTPQDDFLMMAYGQAFGLKLQDLTHEEMQQELAAILRKEVDPGVEGSKTFQDIATEWFELTQGIDQVNPEDINQLIYETEKLGIGLDELVVQTLVELGSMYAEDADLTKFVTHAYIEADGITNGPFMAGFNLGVSPTDASWIRFMQNAGLYLGRETAGNEVRSAQKKDPTQPAPDNYTAVSAVGSMGMNHAFESILVINEGERKDKSDKDEVRNVVASVKNAIQSAFPHIKYDPDTGNLIATRNTAKGPVTVTFYGAGIAGIANDFSKEFRDYIHELSSDMRNKSFAEVAEKYIDSNVMSNEAKQKALVKLLHDIDVALNTRIVHYIDKKTEEPKVFVKENAERYQKMYVEAGSSHFENTTLTDVDTEILAGHLGKFVVKPMRDSLEINAQSTLQATKTVGEATNAMSVIAQLLFNKRIFELESAEGFNPVEGLSPNQVKAVKDELVSFGVVPDVADQVLSLYVEARLENATHEVESISGMGGRVSSNFRGAKESGVSGIPRAVISSGDAAVVSYFLNALGALPSNKILQVYDGINSASDNYKEVGQLANEAVSKAVGPHIVTAILNAVQGAMAPMLYEILDGNTPVNNHIRTYQDVLDLTEELSLLVGEDAASIFVDHSLRMHTGIPNIDLNAIKKMAEKKRGSLISVNGFQIFPTIYTSTKEVKNKLNKMDDVQATLFFEQLQSENPRFANQTYQEFLNNTDNTTDTIIVDSSNTTYGTTDLSKLQKKVAQGFKLLEGVTQSVDQMASGGYPAITTGENIEDTSPEGIASFFHEKQKKMNEEKKAEEDTKPFSRILNPFEFKKGTLIEEAGVYTVADPRDFLNKISKELGENTFTGRVAKHAGYMLDRLSKDNPLFDLRIIVDPSATRNTYSPSDNAIIVNKISPEVLTHELIHALTTRTLDAYYAGDLKNITPRTRKAIQNLEALMAEVISMDETQTSRHWAKAIEHMRVAGNRARAMGRPEVVKARQLSEFIAIFLSDPTIVRDLQGVKTKSKLHQFVDTVVDFLRAVFNLSGSMSNEDILGDIAQNTFVLADNPLITEVEEITDADYLLAFNDGSGTFGLEKEVMNIVNKVIERKVDETNVKQQIAELVKVDPVDQLISSGFHLDVDQQPAFRALAAIITAGSSVSNGEMRELYRLSANVFRNIKPEHFGDTSVPGSAEYYTAMNKYNAVTGAAVGNKKNMVPSLIALTILNDEMKEVVNKIGLPKAEQTSEKDSTFEKKLGQAGYDAIRSINEYLGDSRNKLPAKRMEEILNSLKKPQGSDAANWASLPANVINDLNDKLASGLNETGKNVQRLSAKEELQSNQLGRAFSLGLKALGSLISKDVADKTMNNVLDDLNESGSFHTLKEFARDFIGRTTSNAVVYDMVKHVRSFVQRARQLYVEGVPTNIKKKFKNLPTPGEFSELSNSLLRTDIGAITTIHGVDKTLELLSDSKKLQDRVDDLKKSIGSDDRSLLVLAKAEQLVKYMTTGETGRNLLLNAAHVAKLFGEDMGTDVTLDYIKRVDEYISLRAFQEGDHKAFQKLTHEEREGIHYIMSITHGIATEERAKATSEGSYGIKGYMPTKPTGSLKVIKDSERAKYEAQGYIRIADYRSPRGDFDISSKGYYYSDVSDSRPFSQGIIQNAITTINGIDAHNKTHLSDSLISVPVKNMTKLENDLAKANDKFGLVPVYDDEGNLIGASRALDPEVLKTQPREQNIDSVLGVWRGRQVEEITGDAFNESIIDTLEEEYKKAVRQGKKDQYVNILDLKQFKDDPVMLDALTIMSRTAKTYARENHGRLMVSRGMLSNVVGYRQMGISDIWTGNTGMNPEVREAIRKALEALVGPKAYYYAIKADEIITGLVGDAKQLIIVKSVVVPTINALSNILHLMGRGVNPITIAKEIPKKLAEVEEYSRGVKRLIEIEADKLAAEGSPSKIRSLDAEANAINEYHRKLSIWPLIENGEFTSIVSAQIDHESVNLSKGKVAEFIENQIEKLEGGNKTLAKNLMVTRDTAAYQFLQKATDYGDFIAKAIFYDHQISKGRSKEETLGKVREEFVNYDMLPGRVRGMLERYGLLWFYNYKIRSVKVASAMIRENPLHVLLASQIPTSTAIGNIDMPTTANFITQFFNDELGYTVGPGMGLRSVSLHPLVQVLD